jgi:thiol-disulfide isomerase/thioredoxin
MKHLCFTIILLCTCSTLLYAQEIQAVSDGDYYSDNRYRAGIHFLRELENEHVIGYREKYKIKRPAAWKDKGILSGATYFAGQKNAKTGTSIYFLVTDYYSEASQIIFDVNGNADFNDDSIINVKDGQWFTVTFTNRKDKQALLPRSFFLRKEIRDSSFMRLGALFTQSRSSGPAVAIAWDKPKFFRRIVLPDGNYVTLQDVNCNGFYNDEDDRVLAGDILSMPRLEQNRVRNKKYKPGIELPFAGNTYRLTHVDKHGSSIKVIALNKITDTVERMMPFEYRDDAGVKQRFAVDEKKEYTVLYFWGAWCIGCIKQGPTFAALMKEYEAAIAFQTFNSGDKEENMDLYLTKKKMPFSRWRISKAEAQRIYITAFPGYRVINRNGHVVFQTSVVPELASFLQNTRE